MAKKDLIRAIYVGAGNDRHAYNYGLTGYITSNYHRLSEIDVTSFFPDSGEKAMRVYKDEIYIPMH